jgi:hypothetical protein
MKQSFQAIRHLGISIPKDKIAFKEFHMTSKVGIHCQALWSSMWEVTQKSFRDFIVPNLKDWPGMAEWMSHIQETEFSQELFRECAPKGITFKESEH